MVVTQLIIDVINNVDWTMSDSLDLQGPYRLEGRLTYIIPISVVPKSVTRSF
jgi:hypothetical protein